MEMPYIPDYNSLRFSGCSEKYDKMYMGRKMFVRGVAYQLTIITINSLFGFVWKMDGVYITNYPITHSFQHLTVESAIDYESFISLN